MSNASVLIRACPSLGLMDDSHTSIGFPSIGNYCHCSNPIAPPRFRHQREFCLGGKYGDCPLFLSQEAIPLPLELRIPGRPTDLPRDKSRKIHVIALMVLFVVLIAGWGIVRPRPSTLVVMDATQTATELPIATASFPLMLIPIEPLIVPSEDNTDTRTNTSTRVPISSTAPSNTPSKHQMDVPIGTDYKFVIHKVLDGEKLELFAAKYNTSVEAIVAVNYELATAVWADTLLIIPVGFTDVAKLPDFFVYQVKQEDRGISVEMLAKRFRVSPLDLKYYNDWTNAGDRPLVGDFVLIPRVAMLTQ